MPYKNASERRVYHRKWRSQNRSKLKKYYSENREHILLSKKEYALKNEEKIRIYRKKLKERIPWRSSYLNAKNRCTNKNCKNYKTYGERGIKFLLTKEDVSLLWERDKATSMKRPSIDRINNDRNYEITNCRFIEQSENATKGNYESRWKR